LTLFSLLIHSRRLPAAAPAPEPVFDRRGYYRSPVTLASYRLGKPAANKGQKFPPEPLTPEEVYALMDACGRGPAGLRNRALIMLMYRSGLRVGEALALRPKDVDLERGQVTVLHGKGDRWRVVALDPAACAVVDRWAATRRALGVTGREPLFCVISQPTVGLPIHSVYVRDLLKKLAGKAGIEKRVHPHGLRHSYASYLMERGVPLATIQAMLGHGNLAVTERYMHRLNPAAELERVRTLDWPDPTTGTASHGPPTVPPPTSSPPTDPRADS
jgi:site-specific recombinase XerD